MSDDTFDFSKAMSTPVDDVKRPPTCPPGSYLGIISSFEYGLSSQKKTPYIRFHLQPTAPEEDVDQEELADIDLSKKKFRKDYYLTESAMFMFKDFVQSFGGNTAGRSFEQIVPELVNKPVRFVMERQPNNDGSDFINSIGDVKGA